MSKHWRLFMGYYKNINFLKTGRCHCSEMGCRTPEAIGRRIQEEQSRLHSMIVRIKMQWFALKEEKAQRGDDSTARRSSGAGSQKFYNKLFFGTPCILMSIVLPVIMKAEDIFFRSCVKCIIPGINARRRFWSKFKRWLGVVSPQFGQLVIFPRNSLRRWCEAPFS